MQTWDPDDDKDALREARGIARGLALGALMWAVIIGAIIILGGCAPRSYAPEDRGDGVCFLDGRCVPCEDLPEGGVFPMPRSAE